MATMFKLILFFLFMFIIFNNAKAGKSIIDENVSNGNGLSGGQQYAFTLPAKGNLN